MQRAPAGLLVFLAALLCVGLVLALEPRWLLVAVLPFAVGSVWVTAIDLEQYRIPHVLSGALGAASVIGAVIVAVAVDDPPAGSGWTAVAVPLACGAAAAAFLWLVRRAARGGMGGGDVRLAFSVGVVAATAGGAGAAVVSLGVAFVTASLVGVAVIVVRARRGQRGREARKVPFGPHLSLGALVGAVWGASLWNAYTGLW